MKKILGLMIGLVVASSSFAQASSGVAVGEKNPNAEVRKERREEVKGNVQERHENRVENRAEKKENVQERHEKREERREHRKEKHAQ